MTQDELKQKVAQAALHYIKDVSIVGVGTGSTVRHFIDYLAEFKSDIEGAVSSSEMTTAHLKKSWHSSFRLKHRRYSGCLH